MLENILLQEVTSSGSFLSLTFISLFAGRFLSIWDSSALEMRGCSCGELKAINTHTTHQTAPTTPGIGDMLHNEDILSQHSYVSPSYDMFICANFLYIIF